MILWSFQGFQNGPFNIYSYFVGYSPPTSVNPLSSFPNIHKQAFLSPFTYVAAYTLFFGKNKCSCGLAC